MRVLIVENARGPGAIWKSHLERQGCNVDLVSGNTAALRVIRCHGPEVIVLNLALDPSGALAIADFAAYRSPQSRVIFVTGDSFFSDGSIFTLASNACASVPQAVPPADLCAIVEHYGSAG